MPVNRGELSTLYVFAGFDTAVVSPKDPSWSNEFTTPSPKWSKYSPNPPRIEVFGFAAYAKANRGAKFRCCAGQYGFSPRA